MKNGRGVGLPFRDGGGEFTPGPGGHGFEPQRLHRSEKLYAAQSSSRIAARDEQAAQLLLLNQPRHCLPKWIISPQGSRVDPRLVRKEALAVARLIVVKLVENNQRGAPFLIVKSRELLLNVNKRG